MHCFIRRNTQWMSHEERARRISLHQLPSSTDPVCFARIIQASQKDAHPLSYAVVCFVERPNIATHLSSGAFPSPQRKNYKMWQNGWMNGWILTFILYGSKEEYIPRTVWSIWSYFTLKHISWNVLLIKEHWLYSVINGFDVISLLNHLFNTFIRVCVCIGTQEISSFPFIYREAEGDSLVDPLVA